MCGICGYFGIVDQNLIERMTKTLGLRGPDDTGTALFADQKVALGHCRLSILDLTDAGHQPMFNRDGKICISYNGEVYNFPELRAELEEKGIKFNSRTDTEVILSCYEKYGIEIVKRFDGIFAFAIFDSIQRKIYLVRDHMGVKPLYFSFQNGNLFFGSEIKAILASNKIIIEVNEQALWDYLTFLYVPCPMTMYRGVFQVPPAHILTFDLQSKDYHLDRYWSPLQKPQMMMRDPLEINETVRKQMSKVVKEQLISDVPIGTFLSGGIDSNILVGLMAENSKERVRTFTAIFTDKKASYFNEKERASNVAHKFNTFHQEIEIPIPNLEDVLKMLSWTDQPFGNPTLFLSYLISKEIKRSITVALSGAGGDELFGGYIRYKNFALARRIINGCHVPLSPLGPAILKIWPATIKPEFRNRVYKFFWGLTPDIAVHYLRWAYFLDEKLKGQILRNVPDEIMPSKRIIEKLFTESQKVKGFINVLEYVDLSSYLVDDILEYTDKSSMAASLEVRVPFLSPKMVELSFMIPDQFKIHRGITKITLRNAFKDMIPANNLYAPKKGFSAPARIWVENFEKHFNELEGKLPANGILNLSAIKKMRQEHKDGKFNHGQALFGILMLESWLSNTIFQ